MNSPVFRSEPTSNIHPRPENIAQDWISAVVASGTPSRERPRTHAQPNLEHREALGTRERRHRHGRDIRITPQGTSRDQLQHDRTEHPSRGLRADPPSTPTNDPVGQGSGTGTGLLGSDVEDSVATISSVTVFGRPRLRSEAHRGDPADARRSPAGQERSAHERTALRHRELPGRLLPSAASRAALDRLNGASGIGLLGAGFVFQAVGYLLVVGSGSELEPDGMRVAGALAALVLGVAVGAVVDGWSDICV